MLAHEAPVSALLTDFYQLTMMQSYLDARMDQTAVFEFFVRRLPQGRSFLVAAGLEQLLDHLESLAFTEDEIAWLRETGKFSDRFLKYLRDFRFTGDVDAMPEGTIAFQNEPLVTVTAPIPQAQLVESRLINLLHYETLIASKAARCVIAAPGKLLVDFGMRRAHGAEAANLASRASYLAGFNGTSNVAAARAYGIPVHGTMAHSYIQAHESERAAFEHFSQSMGHAITLLIDTYDTEEGARALVEIAPKLHEQGIHPSGVRLDSGDLGMHARRVRSILDEGGLSQIRIFVSGSLDEHDLHALLRSGAPIDGFGVGTHLDTSADTPYLDCAYKLEEYAGQPKRKVSEGKETWPGRKQVFRNREMSGKYISDTLALAGERLEGEPLLEPVMRAGKRLSSVRSLTAIRQAFGDELSSLPSALRSLESSALYPVQVSVQLQALAREVDLKRQQACAAAFKRKREISGGEPSLTGGPQ